MITRAGPLLVASAFAAAQPLAAQDAWPDWAVAWSPLRPIALDTRRLPFGSPSSQYAFGLPAPSGLLWTAGNPAGLADDVRESRAWMEMARGRSSGTYRRPLDPDDVDTWALAGLGWRPLGRGAVAGRVGFATQDAAAAGGTDARFPYGADPFVVVDTTSPRRNNIHATLEGAAGWRFGGWYAGLGVGLETHRNRSHETRFARTGRSSTSAAQVGLARALAPLHATVAVHGRWLGTQETHVGITRPGGTRMFILSGFHEPIAFDVGSPGGFERRTSGDGFAWGAAATGAVAGVTWTAYGERGRWEAGHVNALRQDSAPTDRFEASATVAGIALRLPLPARLALRLHAGTARLRGEARRADLDGVMFRQADAVVTAGGSLEFADPASRWQVTLVARTERSRLHRDDFLSDVASDIVAWLAEAGLALGYHAGTVTVGGTLITGLYTPVAAIPDPETMGPIYVAYVAPEQAIYAASARPLALALWIRRRFGNTATAYVRASGERVAARSGPHQIPGLPGGQNWRQHLTLGVELTP